MPIEKFTIARKESRSSNGMALSGDRAFHDYVNAMLRLENAYIKSGKPKNVPEAIDRVQAEIETLASRTVQNIGKLAISIIKKFTFDQTKTGVFTYEGEERAVELEPSFVQLQEQRRKIENAQAHEKIQPTIAAEKSDNQTELNGVEGNVVSFKGSFDKVKNYTSNGVKKLTQKIKELRNNLAVQDDPIKNLEQTFQNSTFENRAYLRDYLRRRGTMLAFETNYGSILLGNRDKLFVSTAEKGSITQEMEQEFGIFLNIFNLPAKYRQLFYDYLIYTNPGFESMSEECKFNAVRNLTLNGLIFDVGGNIFLNLGALMYLE